MKRLRWINRIISSILGCITTWWILAYSPAVGLIVLVLVIDFIIIGTITILATGFYFRD